MPCPIFSRVDTSPGRLQLPVSVLGMPGPRPVCDKTCTEVRLPTAAHAGVGDGRSHLRLDQFTRVRLPAFRHASSGAAESARYNNGSLHRHRCVLAGPTLISDAPRPSGGSPDRPASVSQSSGAECSTAPAPLSPRTQPSLEAVIVRGFRSQLPTELPLQTVLPLLPRTTPNGPFGVIGATHGSLFCVIPLLQTSIAFSPTSRPIGQAKPGAFAEAWCICRPAGKSGKRSLVHFPIYQAGWQRRRPPALPRACASLVFGQDRL